MPDIFDEVNEDLRADRARRLFRRYGVLLAAVAVLVIAGVAGWQVWQGRQRTAREVVAGRFIAAMPPPSPSGAAATEPFSPQSLAAFTDIAANGPSGYRSLARLQEAAGKARAGDLPGALALWDQVSADEQADRSLRRVADLMWVQHQVDTGEPALVEGRIQSLIAPDEPWRPLALEARAWLKLRTGDTAGAASALREIVAMPSAPQGVRARANGLLTRLGAAPGQATQLRGEATQG